MTISPGVLLDTSIAQLQTLAAFLAEEMGEYRQRSVVATPEARACKEILLTISVLIPKLQAARYVVLEDGARSMAAVDRDQRVNWGGGARHTVVEEPRGPGHCVNCEDN